MSVPTPDVPETQYSSDDVVVPPYLPDVPDVRADLAEYYQAVSRFDFGRGLFARRTGGVGARGRRGPWSSSTTDHAHALPRGQGPPSSTAATTAPFILRGHRASLPLAPVVSPLINWTDIRPTLHDWCGVPAPEDLPGRSLLPGTCRFVRPPTGSTRFFSHCFHEVVDYNPYRVLRADGRYKFVRNLAAGLTTMLPTDLFRSTTWTAVRRDAISSMGERPTRHVLMREPEELYDLEADPTESVNRIDDPDLQEVAAQMRAQLYQFRRDTADPWLEVDFQEGRIDHLKPR